MRAAVIVAILVIASCGVEAQPQPPSPPPALAPHGAFDIEGDTPIAVEKPTSDFGDLSGMACAPEAHGDDWDCLIVDDELSAAQRVRMDGNDLHPGDSLNLLALATAAAYGAQPEVGCAPRVWEPDETPEISFDLEAISMDDGMVYLFGSHGCSRKRFEFDEHGFLITRFAFDPAQAPQSVEYSYRLSEALRAVPALLPHFGRPLQEYEPRKTDLVLPGEQGLNIEGGVIADGVVHVGLRAPSLNGEAYIVSVAAAELFAPTETPLASMNVRRVPLGPDTGIRDMAALSNGALLLLVGPTEEQDTPYALVLFDADDQVRPLGELRREEYQNDKNKTVPAKAEVVMVIEESADQLRLLIAFDGPKGGRPLDYRVPLR